MLPAPSLNELRRTLSEKPAALIGLLFAPPYTKVASETIVPRLGYLDARSGKFLHFFCAGYFGYGSPNDGDPIGEMRYPNGTVIPWSFSQRWFADFVREIEEVTSWKYSGECDLILVGPKFSFNLHDPNVEFSEAVVLDIDTMMRDGAIHNAAQLFEAVMAFARSRQWMASIDGLSDKQGLRLVGDVASEAILKYLPTPAHYGAPTRLLDWSDGALIGLYFAVRQNRGFHDAAVWMLDPWWLNGKSTGVEEVVLPGDPEILPRDKRRVDPWLRKRFEEGRRRRMPSRPAAVYPGHIIRRIGAQRSCFTIHGTDPNGLDKIAASTRSHLTKIVIPSFRVEGIRNDLETCGIDDITIFPDLEGLSRTLEKKWKGEEKTLPHEGVVTRLARSSVHGIGLFAIRAIKKGTKLFPGDIDEMMWVEKGELGRLPKLVAELYRDFAVLKDGRYGCPLSFNRLTPAWYLNHSKTPNVRCDENFDFLAIRNIKVGEELTADYSTYSE